MPRKPNYNFERAERDRLKAEKKARSKAEKDAKKNPGRDPDAPADD